VTSIIVHGGAGTYSPGAEHEKALVTACGVAARVLASGGSACDAAVEATVSMEDAPVLNAGYGSSLNLAGDVENDASIMLDDMSCGSVAALHGFANPILAARHLMELTDHVLLVGRGADAFARHLGLAERDQRSPDRIERHRKALARLDRGDEIHFMPRLRGFYEQLRSDPDWDHDRDPESGTVGIVVRDERGRMAAASSTGGMMLKLPGRVGDTGVIGAGTYCDGRGGVSATGHGEPVIRHGMGRALVEAFAEVGAAEAMERVMRTACDESFEFGLIGIPVDGDAAIGFSTQAMSWAALEGETLRTFLTHPIPRST